MTEPVGSPQSDASDKVATWPSDAGARTEPASLPADDGDFDLYAESDARREREAADTREELFRRRLQDKVGDKPDEHLMRGALDALRARGADITPDAVAAEYRSAEGKLRDRFEDEKLRRFRLENGHRTAVHGMSIPPGRRAGPPAPKIETFVETIKKSQRARNLYAY